MTTVDGEDYYVCVEQEYSRLLSIDEDYYARVEQEYSRLPSIDSSIVGGIYSIQASYILDQLPEV